MQGPKFDKIQELIPIFKEDNIVEIKDIVNKLKSMYGEPSYFAGVYSFPDFRVDMNQLREIHTVLKTK